MVLLPQSYTGVLIQIKCSKFAANLSFISHDPGHDE
jgi:hypothetical protein